MKTARVLAAAGLAVFGLIVPLLGVAEAQQGGTIQGIVQLSCPGDLAGTLVFLPGRSFVVITDSSGAFELDSVPAGTYTVRIEAPGQGPQKDIAGVVVKNSKVKGLHTVTLGDLQTGVNNCGVCGTVCSAVNGTPSCAAGQCLITCNSGFEDCNNDPGDGCETSLTTVTNCGACGHVCSAANATSACTAGTCQIVGCVTGFADCNNDPSDGCETSLNTVTNCGGCGHVCSPVTNGTPACTNGSCTTSCSNGFADCNHLYFDGCEIDTQTDHSNCGTCGHACSFLQSCISGSCQ